MKSFIVVVQNSFFVRYYKLIVNKKMLKKYKNLINCFVSISSSFSNSTLHDVSFYYNKPVWKIKKDKLIFYFYFKL